MKISYNWLKEITGLNWSPTEMAQRLTLCGTQCEEIESTSEFMGNVIIGQVVDVKAIAGADKIKHTIVDVGRERLEVVCGAPNVNTGQRVPVALPGAKLAGDFIARHTEPVSVKNGHLVLRVTQPAMRFHLEQIKPMLLTRIRSQLGQDRIMSVKFTLG